MKTKNYLKLIIFLCFFSFYSNAQVITTTLDPTVRDKTNLDIGFNRRSDSGTWWTDNSFKGLVSDMNPDIARYPGGTQANYWDWRTGKFLDNTDKTWGANMEVLGIPQFVNVIPQRTKIIYVVNMARPTPITGVSVNASEATLKSTATLNLKINDMLAAIAEFGAQGKLPYAIELGNEFFFGNPESGIFEVKQVGSIFYSGWDPVNNQAYQSANVKDATVIDAKFYLDQCKIVVAAIKAQYPTMKFALVTTKRGSGTSARESWNNTIYDELANNTNYATLKNDIYALTQHHYVDTNYGDQTVINNIATAKVAISEGIQYPIDRQLDYDQSPAAYKIWYTEYGVTKLNAELTWATGVRFAALAHSWIKRGDKVGQLDYHYISDANVVKVAVPMKLAPIGIAAKLVAKATADMTEMQEISFANNPISVNLVKSLYGYKFKSANKETLLIINTSDTNFSQVQFNNLFSFTGQPVMTQYYSNTPYVSGVFEGDSNILFSTGNVNSTVGISNFSVTVVEVANVSPSAPSSVVATPVNCTSANLTWTDNSSDEDGFNILKSSDGINYILAQTVSANIGTFSFTNLSPSTVYSFKVNSFNTIGTSANGFSNSITTVACPVNYALSVAATNGSVSPSNGTYLHGSNVTLTATPNAGYQFSNWSGDIDSTVNPVSVLMNSNKNIVANFSQIQTTTTLTPNADAYVRNGSFKNTNYGSNVKLEIRETTIKDAKRIAYLKFNLMGMTNITSVILEVKNIGLNGTINVLKVSNDTWSESTMTWNNQPTLGTNIGSFAVNETGTYSIDVTNYVTAEALGDKVVTFALTGVSGESLLTLDSKEATVAPKLIITRSGSAAKMTLGKTKIEATEPLLKVYPNPTSENVTIAISDADLENGSILVYDYSGKEISSSKITASKMDINLKGASGIYIVKIFNRGVTTVRQIIKK